MCNFLSELFCFLHLDKESSPSIRSSGVYVKGTNSFDVQTCKNHRTSVFGGCEEESPPCFPESNARGAYITWTEPHSHVRATFQSPEACIMYAYILMYVIYIYI